MTTNRWQLSSDRRALLAKLLQADGVVATDTTIPRRAEAGPTCLSFAQHRLWFLDQLSPGSAAYNITTGVHLTGQLNVAALEQSLSEIVRRHEALRTSFAAIEGQPVQVVVPAHPLPLPVTDLGPLPTPEREAHALRMAAEEADRPFDLAHGPLFRAHLYRLNRQDHILLLTVHHIAFDGWSTGILFRELTTLYEAFSAERPSPLSELPIQYADFAEWQRQWLQGELIATQLAYWLKQLGGTLPLLDLPTHRPRPASLGSNGASQTLAVPEAITRRLKGLAGQENATLFMTVLAVFKALLYRYTGLEDILVGSPVANRNRAETDQLIGFFVNTLVFRTDVNASLTFRELLGRVREVALGAYAHQDLPFEKLVEALRPDRQLTRTPLFQVMFTLQNGNQKGAELPGLEVHPLNFESTTTKFDLSLSLVDGEDGMSGVVEYNHDLFDGATIGRLLGHFLILLAGIAANPDRRLGEYPLLTPGEQDLMVGTWNDTASAYARDRCAHELFESQARETPDAVAVVSGHDSLTYRELDRRANQLAHTLRSVGVGPDVITAIYATRSVAMAVAILGVWKAGGAYLPIDPLYPRERIAHMLADAQVPVVLTHSQMVADLPEHGARVVCLDSPEAFADEPVETPGRSAVAENLAYVIYTSGSTGKPKGVQIEHGSLLHLSAALKEAVYKGRRAALRVSLNAPLAFDASVQQLQMLLHGHSLYIVPQDVRLETERFLSFIRTNRLDVLDCTPSQLRTLIDAGLLDEAAHAPSVVLVGGEPIDEALWQTLAGARHIAFYNVYGPTECTVDATTCRVQHGDPVIGRPLPNVELFILDGHMQPVPIGVPGELYIGGAGLARGYLNRPELTAERFIAHPFRPQTDARLYKTGDLVRYLPDGSVAFLGRADHQVKIRGFRIELGEIEEVLSQHPAVRRTVVVTGQEPAGHVRLVAYVIPMGEPAPTSRDLRTYVKQHLPDYMVPSLFVFVDTLPLTPNGKVDRAALPAPEATAAALAAFVAPRDPLELSLAQTWESVLGVQPVGVTENFFELGGHSLLAVELLTRIRKETGRTLPLASLFQEGTIEHLATLLRHQPAVQPHALVVGLRTAGARRPLFFIHPAGGNILCYYQLARHLGAEQPFYAVQARGLTGAHPPATSVESMAAAYIEEIRAIQPQGPYLLGGWSAGGLIAVEMAQQLRAQAEAVAMVAIVDVSPDPVEAEETQDDSAVLADLFGEVPLSVDRLRQLAPDDRLTYVLEHAKRASLVPPDLTPSELRQLVSVFVATVQACNRYTPAAYAGPITLFVAGERQTADEDLGWSRVSPGRVDVHVIPGDHRTMIEEAPNARILAEQLLTTLDAIEA